MASNYTTTTTTTSNLPPLPNYTLTERPSLIPGVSDVLLQMISPVVAYWVVSLFFHIIDTFDLCSQYRLHTPAEILKRNHVSRFEVLRDVIIQQILQFAFGVAIAWFDPPEMIGREEYDVAVWAQRIRIAQTYLPSALATIGLNAPKLANNLYDTYPTMASALIGGQYGTTGFATWETKLATAIYHFGIPAVQFIAAILFVDTWQYFIHRAMHMNKFLYTWLHSRHHKLYVPYAYGALYNHPLEGLFLDTLGTGIGYLITGMTVRQGLVFFTSSTIKTVDDHCGYAFPWDPLQHITSNNAAYHDIHHQSWGIKTNFSQPFLTIWDRLLDTTWKGGDVSSRYERVRIAAQRKYDADIDLNKAAKQAHESQKLVLETDGAQILEDEKREENDVRRRENIKRTPRRRTTSFDPRSTLAAVPSLHGTASPILHANVH